MALWLQPPRLSTHTPGFSSLFRMLDDFDKHAQQSLGPGSLQTFAPKFDVAEHEKNYVLQGELPGVPPENVSVEFTDPQTMIVRGRVERERTEGDPSLTGDRQIEQGEKSEVQGEKNEGGSKEVAAADAATDNKPAQPKYWLSERSYGEFSRVFSFPVCVDQDKVEAKFEHGILNITVPKAENKAARKIEIKK